MKKVICGLLVCASLLSLWGCGGKEPEKEASFPVEQTAQTLLESGALSEELEELDPTLLFPLSGDAENYAGSVLYYSTGATMETVDVISVADSALLAETEKVLTTWVEDQIQTEREYRPAEVEKLEHAILETRGSTVLLVVAADWEKAAQAIQSLSDNT